MTEDTRLGTIDVHPIAIASVASDAVLECYGVVGMAANVLRDGLAELLQRGSYQRGVEARVDDQCIAIDLYVILEYGVRISEVAHNIMSTVKFNVEKTLGMPVSEVNVHVQGLRVSSKE